MTLRAADATVEALRRLVEEHFRKERLLGFYAEKLAMTPDRLNDHVKRATGVTAGHLIRQRVLTEAKRRSCSPPSRSRRSPTLAFSDPSHFARFFRKQTGTTPQEFREGGEGAKGNRSWPRFTVREKKWGASFRPRFAQPGVRLPEFAAAQHLHRSTSAWAALRTSSCKARPRRARRGLWHRAPCSRYSHRSGLVPAAIRPMSVSQSVMRRKDSRARRVAMDDDREGAAREMARIGPAVELERLAPDPCPGSWSDRDCRRRRRPAGRSST